MNPLCNKRKAFTLLEIILSIALLAMMIASAVYNFSNSAKRLDKDTPISALRKSISLARSLSVVSAKNRFVIVDNEKKILSVCDENKNVLESFDFAKRNDAKITFTRIYPMLWENQSVSVGSLEEPLEQNFIMFGPSRVSEKVKIEISYADSLVNSEKYENDPFSAFILDYDKSNDDN